jgi:phosphatidylserine decarboxylase
MKFKIHKEGPPIIITTLLVLDLALVGAFFALRGTSVFWLFWVVLAIQLVFIGLVINFFRSPVFPIVAHDDHILAPANGKVVVIEEVHEPVYFQKKMLQISIFMSPLDVHVNRTPVRGHIQWFQYFPGKYLVAWHPKSSTENEQTFMVQNGPHGEVGVKQIAGALARRIKWYVAPGEEMAQGEEYGFIRFGSRVDVLLPIGTKVTVQLGQKTKGGRTVIAQYKS